MIAAAGPLEWGVAAHPYAGEEQMGDRYVVCARGDGSLLAVIDGIGHGPDAARASRLAASMVESQAEEPLDRIILLCHAALRGSRGAVMTLAAVEDRCSRLIWLGVGNVEGRILRRDGRGVLSIRELRLRNGTVGHSVPPALHEDTIKLEGGELLLLATDGIRPDFALGLRVGQALSRLASSVLLKSRLGTDDALVLVARLGGGT